MPSDRRRSRSRERSSRHSPDRKKHKSSHRDHRHSDRDHRHSDRDHHRCKKDDRHHNVKIKTEEEFDRRQERARRNRETNHERRRFDDYVKQEPGLERREVKQESSTRHDREYYNNQRRRNQAGREDEVKQAFQDKKAPPEKEKPNLGLSGNLAADTNTYKGVVIKYNEPPEARIPKRKWRLYPFKENESLKIMHLHRQSAYLLGRLARIADIPIHHPSCSKQHAVFQFRAVEKNIKGITKKVVRPYIIDLNSGNGTFLNGDKIEPQRYYELKEKDVLKFGLSTRDYVLLHDKTDTSEVAQNESSSSEDED